jgi:hypothetical protein
MNNEQKNTELEDVKSIYEVTSEDKKTYKVSDEIKQISDAITKRDETISQLKKENKTDIKTVFNLFLSEIKNIENNPLYKTYTKKGKAARVELELDKKLNHKLTKLLFSVSVYYISGSNLNFNDKKLSITKFNDGMDILTKINLYNIKKFKSNKQLFDKLFEIEKSKNKKKYNL